MFIDLTINYQTNRFSSKESVVSLLLLLLLLLLFTGVNNNNNGNFICVFECTIVNLATYRQ